MWVRPERVSEFHPRERSKGEFHMRVCEAPVMITASTASLLVAQGMTCPEKARLSGDARRSDTLTQAGTALRWEQHGIGAPELAVSELRRA
jgi:hypothetical protein